MVKKTQGYLLIAAAGTLWGTVGLFVTKLLEAQLSIHNIVFIECFCFLLSSFFFSLPTEVV